MLPSGVILVGAALPWDQSMHQEVHLKYIETANNLADAFAKPLDTAKHFVRILQLSECVHPPTLSYPVLAISSSNYLFMSGPLLYLFVLGLLIYNVIILLDSLMAFDVHAVRLRCVNFLLVPFSWL